MMNHKKIKNILLLPIVVFVMLAVGIAMAPPAKAGLAGPYTPDKYDSVSVLNNQGVVDPNKLLSLQNAVASTIAPGIGTIIATFNTGQLHDDLRCEIINSSEIDCHKNEGKASTTCGVRPGTSDCAYGKWFYDPVISAKAGLDVFVNENGSQSDADKIKDYGYIVFPLSQQKKANASAEGNLYSAIVLTDDYTKFAPTQGLFDIVNNDDNPIVADAPEGICSVVLNSEKPQECTVGGRIDSGITSSTTGKVRTVAEQGDYISGAGDFVTDKGGGDCDAGGLDFILCPIKNLLEEAVNSITTFIIKALSVPTEVFGTSSDLKQGFNQVLLVANSFFALIFLIAIFATGLSIGPDNYTIKKVLPRLVAAVILAQFSYYFSVAIIEIGNVLGRAVPNTITGGTSAVIGNFADSAVGSSLAGIVFLLLFLLFALVACLIGFFVLALRQIILIALVVLAPVAFAAWVLPGTEKVFKLWWNNLIKLTLMYPLMSTILIGSFWLQGIILDAYSGDVVIIQVGAAALPFIALMYLPKTFKMSGNLISGAAGKINDIGQKQTIGRAQKKGKELYSGDDGLKNRLAKNAPAFGKKGLERKGRAAAALKNAEEGWTKGMDGDELAKYAGRSGSIGKTARKALKEKHKDLLEKQLAVAARGESPDQKSVDKLKAWSKAYNDHSSDDDKIDNDGALRRLATVQQVALSRSGASSSGQPATGGTAPAPSHTPTPTGGGNPAPAPNTGGGQRQTPFVPGGAPGSSGTAPGQPQRPVAPGATPGGLTDRATNNAPRPDGVIPGTGGAVDLSGRGGPPTT